MHVTGCPCTVAHVTVALYSSVLVGHRQQVLVARVFIKKYIGTGPVQFRYKLVVQLERSTDSVRGGIHEYCTRTMCISSTSSGAQLPVKVKLPGTVLRCYSTIMCYTDYMYVLYGLYVSTNK